MSNTWIQDYNGNQFDLVNPTVDTLDFEVTAHCLSRIPRFNGHTVQKWPAAAHVCCVSGLLILEGQNLETVLYGLHHDDSEAYMCDIPSPLKYMPGMEKYRETEHKYQDVVIEKLGISKGYINFTWVKICDLISLIAEAETLMSRKPIYDWTSHVRDEVYSLGLPSERTNHLINVTKQSITRLVIDDSYIEQQSYKLYVDSNRSFKNYYASEKEKNPTKSVTPPWITI